MSNISNNDNDIFKLDLKAKMIANTNIEDTKNTIFLFIETNENNHDNLKKSKLGKLIDIVIDDSKMRSYRYNDLEGNDSLIISNLIRNHYQFVYLLMVQVAIIIIQQNQ